MTETHDSSYAAQPREDGLAEPGTREFVPVETALPNAQSAQQSALVERHVAGRIEEDASRFARIVFGPYRSGKTLNLLNDLVRHCQKVGFSGQESLLIVPSKRYQRLVEKRIEAIVQRKDVDESNSAGGRNRAVRRNFARFSQNLSNAPRRPGIVGLRVAPFYEACTTVLRRCGLANAVPSVIPESVRPAIISRVLWELNKQGRLEHLLPIVDFAGTHGAVLELIDELERAGLSPQHVLARLDASASASSRFYEFAIIYERYWQELNRIGYLDNRRIAFACREALAASSLEEPMFSFVGVDGFDRFNQLQLSVLSELSRHSEQTVICFDYIEEGGLRHSEREEYLWKDSSFEDLKSAFPVSAFTCTNNYDDWHPDEHMESLDISAVQTVDRFFEMDEIARAIKSTLVHSQAKPEEILVVVPSMKNYKGTIEAAFEDAGVPYFVDEAIRIVTLPVVHFLLRLIRMHKEEFRRNELVKAIRNRFFAAENFDLTTDDTVTLDRVSFKRGIVGGAGEWLRIAEEPGLTSRLKALINCLTPPSGHVPLTEFVSWAETMISRCLAADDELECRDPQLYWVEQRALAEMRNCFASLVQEDTILYGAGGLHAGARNSGAGTSASAEAGIPAIYGTASPSRIGAGGAAASIISSSASGAASANSRKSRKRVPQSNAGQLQITGEITGSITDYEGFLKKLSHVIERSNFRMPRASSNGVTICSVDLADNRIYDHIYICGLVEGEFPRRVGSRGFIGADEIGRWKSFGVDIHNPRHHPSFEYALFNSLIKRARKKVRLSYPLWDMSGEELLPSFFLTGELQDLAVSESEPYAASGEHPVSARDMLTGYLWRTADGSMQEVPSADNTVEEMKELLAPSIAMTQARGGDAGNSQRSPFNGYLADSVSTGALDVRVPKRWSASKLNDYGKCPFKYWVSHVLNLDLFEEPSLELDARLLGETYHLALEKFYGVLIERGWSLTNTDRKELEALFEIYIDEAILWLEGKRGAAKGEFWEYEKIELTFRLRRFFDKEMERALEDEHGFTPHMVEAPFGMDEHSNPPLRISDGRRSIEFRGKIDRIDVAANGSIARVVDYKAGSTAIGKREALEGRNLQLPIYALAVERSVLPRTKVVSGSYLSISSGKPIGSLEFSPISKGSSPGDDKANRETTVGGTQGAEPREGGKSRSEKELPDLRAMTESYALDYVERMAAGIFIVDPATPTVCAKCDHFRVCRIAELKRTEEQDEFFEAGGSI